MWMLFKCFILDFVQVFAYWVFSRSVKANFQKILLMGKNFLTRSVFRTLANI